MKFSAKLCEHVRRNGTTTNDKHLVLLPLQPAAAAEAVAAAAAALLQHWRLWAY
jgi:hypothetical protein